MRVTRVVGLCLAAFFCFSSLVVASVAKPENGYDKNKAKLLSYVLGQQLQRNHFSHKPMDDALSKEAFSLYLKQIDGESNSICKRILMNYSIFL